MHSVSVVGEACTSQKSLATLSIDRVGAEKLAWLVGRSLRHYLRKMEITYALYTGEGN